MTSPCPPRPSPWQRIARRPLRAFIVGWPIATALWLATGSIHAWRATRPATPPTPDAVPYHDHLAGGPRPAAIAVAERDLPVYDAQAPWYDSAHPRLGRTLFVPWPTEGRPRLLCIFSVDRGAYGWPRQWLRWSTDCVYDVGDPSKPFAPAASLTNTRVRRVEWEPHQVTVSRPDAESPARVMTYTWQWARMLSWALAVEAAVAAAVVVIWWIGHTRHARRVRRGRCLACGYDRRGLGAALCPECGGAHADEPRSVEPPLGRRFLATWTTLVVLWLLVSVAGARTTHPDNTEAIERLERGESALYPNDATGAAFSHVPVAVRRIGWPFPFLVRQDMQVLRCVAGERAAPFADPGYVTGSSPVHRYRSYRTSATDDPTVFRHRAWALSHLMAQVAFLQLPSLAAVLVLAAVARRRR